VIEFVAAGILPAGEVGILPPGIGHQNIYLGWTPGSPAGSMPPPHS